jgi:hypothetical protein
MTREQLRDELACKIIGEVERLNLTAEEVAFVLIDIYHSWENSQRDVAWKWCPLPPIQETIQKVIGAEK